MITESCLSITPAGFRDHEEAWPGVIGGPALRNLLALFIP
jgi:hypothetical protein